MTRLARVKGEFNTYHIIQRGNERKNIFLSDDDRNRFLDTLKRMKEKYNFKLEAYCLMDNHVHLIINDNGNDISKIVKSINISYAYYFNHVYKRIGHLFQDRFKSEIIEDDIQLLAVSAYIHNNPVKAGMVKSPEDYKWSSFNSFIIKKKDNRVLVDAERILMQFSVSKNKAVEEYYNYVKKYEKREHIMDVEEDEILYSSENGSFIESYSEGEVFVKGILEKNGIDLEDLKRNKEIRVEVIVGLRKNSCLNLKEIGQLAGGLSPSMVCKILNK